MFCSDYRHSQHKCLFGTVFTISIPIYGDRVWGFRLRDRVFSYPIYPWTLCADSEARSGAGTCWSLHNLCSMLDDVCHDVTKEPPLQPLTGETFELRSTNISETARLDISARGFWSPHIPQRAFFDVRVFHPNAPSYVEVPMKTLFHRHEQEKKRQYGRRIQEVEYGSFTPLVFSSIGGAGRECDKFLKQLALLHSSKMGNDYGRTINWIRTTLSFSLIRSALTCLRGTRSWRTTPYYNERPGPDASVATN